MNEKTKLVNQVLSQFKKWELDWILYDYGKNNYLEEILFYEKYQFTKTPKKEFKKLIAYEHMTPLQRIKYNKLDCR